MQDRSESEREHMIDTLHRAINDKQFVFYQPKVDLYTGEAFAVEALIRWQHPQKGLIAPGYFLPFIEQHQLIEQIDEWVIEEAFSQCAAWHQKGIKLPISINISQRTFSNGSFVDNFRRILMRYPQLPRGAIDIEILETVEMNNIEQVRDIINILQGSGVTFSLDDFGTGFSSLTY